MSEAREVWICGRYYGVMVADGRVRTAWAPCGIFGSRDAAVATCRTENDFIAPFRLNDDLTNEEGALGRQEYPLNPRGTEPADMPDAVALSA